MFPRGKRGQDHVGFSPFSHRTAHLGRRSRKIPTEHPTRGVSFATLRCFRWRCRRRNGDLHRARGWKIEFIDFLEHLPRPVERMLQPEIRRQRMLCCCRDYAVLDRVAFLQPEDAHGFHAHILIGGEFLHGWIRGVHNGARQKFARAAVCVADAHQRNLHLLKRAIVIKRQPRKLVRSQNVVDLDDGVDFLPRIPVDLKPDVRFQQLYLEGKIRLAGALLRRGCFFLGRVLRRFGRFLPVLLCEGRPKYHQQGCQQPEEAKSIACACHGESLGAAAPRVKRRLVSRCPSVTGPLPLVRQ